MINIIKNKKILLNKKFKLVDILQYNFDIENIDIKKFLNEDEDFYF